MMSLHDAAQNDSNFHIAQILLNSGSNPNKMNQKGQTPLLIACESSSEKMVELLSSHSKSLNFQDQNGQTSLHIACRQNQSKIMRILINAGADLNVKDDLLQTPIFLTNPEGMKVLQKAGADVFLSDSEGNTLFHHACIKNIDCFHLFEKSLKLLLNARNKIGWTPLMCAASLMNFEAIRKLIHFGADTTLIDSKGRLALHLVAGANLNNDAKWFKSFKYLLYKTPLKAIEKFAQFRQNMFAEYRKDYPKPDNRSLPCLLIDSNGFEERTCLFPAVSYLLLRSQPNTDILKYLDLLLSRQELSDPEYDWPFVSSLNAAVQMHEAHHVNCVCLEVLTRILDNGVNPDEARGVSVFVVALEYNYMDAIKVLMKYSSIDVEDLALKVVLFRIWLLNEVDIRRFFSNITYAQLWTVRQNLPPVKLEHFQWNHSIFLESVETTVPTLMKISRLSVRKQLRKQSGKDFLTNLKLLDIPPTLVEFLRYYDL